MLCDFVLALFALNISETFQERDTERTRSLQNNHSLHKKITLVSCAKVIHMDNDNQFSTT